MSVVGNCYIQEINLMKYQWILSYLVKFGVKISVTHLCIFAPGRKIAPPYVKKMR